MDLSSSRTHNLFFRDRIILVSFWLGIAIHSIVWVLIISKFGFSGATIPLHFNVVTGIDLTGSSNQLFELAFMGLVVIVVNSIIARELFRIKKLFAYITLGMATIVQVFLILALIAVVVLNS